MRINDRRVVILVAVGTTLCFGVAHGQSETRKDFEGILKGALEDLVEKKADEAGISISGSDMPDKVRFRFAGAAASPPEIFEAIGPSINTGSSSSGNVAAEQACYNAVQGKIPWDANGVNKNWSASNVRNLCKGTTNAPQPGSCFRTAMFNGASWGKTSSHSMTWSEASQLCGGTNNASQTISCLKGQIAGGKSLGSAVGQCDRNPDSAVLPDRLVYIPSSQYQVAQVPESSSGQSPTVRDHRTSGKGTTPQTNTQTAVLVRPGMMNVTSPDAEAQCFDYVQGDIAWDTQRKNKSWGSSNLKRLCKGTSSKSAPGDCFKYAMHRGSSWGRTSKHPMTWQKAIDLCEGTNNATTTTSCFRRAIGERRSLDNAIARCDK